MKNHVVLTGCTGFLGRYLLWDLLKDGVNVCAVVRAECDDHASKRVDEVLRVVESQTDDQVKRPVCFKADIADSKLGLSPTALSWIKQNCGSILHNAATVSFNDNGNDSIFEDNLLGARNLLDMCRETDIRNLHHVSTAYVCGVRDGVIKESELDCGQQFRNQYERSKFEIEKLFRSSDVFEKLTIYRPAAIAGDSVSGYTHTFHGVFHYLKLISVIVSNVEPDPDGRRHTPIKLDMNGNEKRNIVPVEWVSKVICNLHSNKQAHGHTFHLAPDVSLTPRQIIDAGYSYFNSYGIEFCGARAVIENQSQLDHDWHSNMEIYKSYEHSDPEFDCSNLKRFAAHLPCPEISEDVLHRYWTFGERVNWGKRAAKNGRISHS